MNPLDKVVILFEILISLFSINLNANLLVYNCLNVTSSDSERLRVLNYGFDTAGSMNISVEFLKPFRNVYVSERGIF